MRYLIRFSYDGTLFHGFQRQKNVKNVQGLLEQTLSGYFGQDILIKGSGRTDAGVHAKCQCAHFDISKKVTWKDIKCINKILNGEIVINNLKLVDNNFHARHDVKKKTYVYKINVGKYKSNYEGYYYQIKYDLNIKKMREASKVFVGVHDYRNFVSGYRDDYESVIYNIKISKFGNVFTFKFVGAGFYRYMVRHLVGALVDVGKGKVDINTIYGMIDNKEFTKKLCVVPACGLYLTDIKY